MPHALAPAHVQPALELDRLDVYRVSLEFQRLTAAATVRVRGELRSQLERASLSVPLNCAEGFGRRSAADTSTRSPAAAPSSAPRSSTSWLRAVW
jgi:hypothetical protein